MSSAETGGDERPRREVAHRIFAAEFDDATLSYSESDEERAPNYVVTPTGARANRLFVAGVLTELDELGNGQLRARIVDPTGAFVVYAGQYQPEALAALERLDPPAFVAVTGKARTFQPEDSNRVFTSIRPEAISEIDATTRDRWIVETAARTLDRVGKFAAALVESGSAETVGTERNGGAESERSGPRSGISLAREHYGTTPTYLAAIRELALDAARLVAGNGEEVGSLDRTPDEKDRETETDLAALASGPLGGTTVATIVDGDGESPATATTEAEPTSTLTSGAERSGTGTGGATAVDATATDAASPDESSVAEETAPSEGDDPLASGSEAVEDDEIEAIGETGEGDGFDGAGSLGGSDDLGTTGIGGEDGKGTEDDEIEDFEGEFDLSDDERAEIEAEYGTDFSTGAEVNDPGEAGIEPDAPPAGGDETDGSPDADTASTDPSERSEPSGSGSDAGGEEVEVTDASAETTDPELDPKSQSVSEPEGTLSDPDVEPEGADDEPNGRSSDAEDDGGDGSDVGTEIADEPASEGNEGEADADDEATPDGSEGAGDVDVTEAVMDAMRDLDDGDGADREAVVERVSDEHGVSADEVDDAIQDALMGGQCYEPGDGTLKAI